MVDLDASTAPAAKAAIGPAAAQREADEKAKQAERAQRWKARVTGSGPVVSSPVSAPAATVTTPQAAGLPAASVKPRGSPPLSASAGKAGPASVSPAKARAVQPSKPPAAGPTAGIPAATSVTDKSKPRVVSGMATNSTVAGGKPANMPAVPAASVQAQGAAAPGSVKAPGASSKAALAVAPAVAPAALPAAALASAGTQTAGRSKPVDAIKTASSPESSSRCGSTLAVCTSAAACALTYQSWHEMSVCLHAMSADAQGHDLSDGSLVTADVFT